MGIFDFWCTRINRNVSGCIYIRYSSIKTKRPGQFGTSIIETADWHLFVRAALGFTHLNQLHPKLCIVGRGHAGGATKCRQSNKINLHSPITVFSPSISTSGRLPSTSTGSIVALSCLELVFVSTPLQSQLCSLYLIPQGCH